ncbi:MAG: DUF1684 domain-containing protein [bacterium]|nr:DUF1684 domain-containing protein [bacterium]
MSQSQIDQLRKQKDDFFRNSHQSPLTPEQQDVFDGLRYYDYNPALDLTVEVVPFEQQNLVPVQTTTGEVRQYRRYGEFTFMVDGEEARLTIYEAPHGYFLPFVDSSAGEETYPAGRYLEPDQLPDGRFHIDFNQAYNPFCAYGDGWSCPITPLENRLKVAVRAGEKIPAGEWAQML